MGGSPQDFETIRWSFDEETGVGRLVLDRPGAMNALSAQSRAELEAGFAAFDGLDEAGDGVAVRAVVVSGAGDRAFCTGLDLTEQTERQHGAVRPLSVFTLPAAFPAPVVAAIDGYCVGGGLEFALACDFRLATRQSQLGFPEVGMGTMPGGGGISRLRELVGPARTKELCMTSEFISGAEAAREGIVTAAVADAEIDGRVTALVNSLCEQPPLALRAIKDAVDHAADASLDAGIRFEKRAADALLDTDDHERARTVDDDEQPDWTGT